MALLEVRGATKHYPGVTALADVDLDVGGGQVHALLGENGAGKSTLMKAVAGSVVLDAGTIGLAGEDLPAGDPDEARRRGVGIVYQELSLVPTLSLAENVLLGRWPRSRWGMVDWSALRERAAEHLARVGLGGRDPDQRLGGLPMADRQLVEVAKALSTDARLILLDEPTSALSEPEAVRLFQLIRELTEAGVGIVYVSHRLAEVLRIADRVTVLRDGGHVGTRDVGEVDETTLAVMMVGRDLDDAAPGAPADTGGGEAGGAAVLEAEGIARPPRLRPVDLRLRAGEVVAVFGLVGSGRGELSRVLAGLDPARAGRIRVRGEEVTIASPADANRLGIGYLAQDRAESIVPRMSTNENITLAALDRISAGGLLDFDTERRIGERYVDELDIRVRSPEQPAETLSGGNQQKVILARWLASESQVLVLDDATRGIDVGAKEEVFRLVRRLAADGVAILYLTSEIREAKALADRVLVMAGGSIVRELPPGAPREDIMEAAGGVRG